MASLPQSSLAGAQRALSAPRPAARRLAAARMAARALSQDELKQQARRRPRRRQRPLRAAAPPTIPSQGCLSASLAHRRPPLPPDTAQAAWKAVDYIKSGMVVGLGTGSTAAFAVERLGALLKSGELKDVVAVPTSVRTYEQALALGIPLATLDEQPRLDVAIDGADEVRGAVGGRGVGGVRGCARACAAAF
jgi:hypothetical protein